MAESSTLQSHEISLAPETVARFCVQPHFQDTVPDAFGYSGALGEFTLDTKVQLNRGKALVDVWRNMSVLQQAGAKCGVDFKQVATTSNRKLYVTELAGGTRMCPREIMVGDLHDLSEEQFIAWAIEYFKKAMGVDITANSYFGDINRSEPEGLDQMNFSLFDGVFKKINGYYTGSNDALRPTKVNVGGASDTLTPADAYNLLVEMVAKQSYVMKTLGVMEKGFYVNYNLGNLVQEYLTSTGVGSNIGYLLAQGKMLIGNNGMPVMSIKNIPVYINPKLDQMMGQILGTGYTGYSAILQPNKNFLYGMDETYSDPNKNRNTAFEAWYERKDQSWYTRAYVTGGTEILSPQNIVYSITDGIIL